jgi:hypothetical protein
VNEQTDKGEDAGLSRRRSIGHGAALVGAGFLLPPLLAGSADVALELTRDLGHGLL